MLPDSEGRKIVIIMGTRPEVIKLLPVLKIFDREKIDYTLIHTGQHHDYNLFLNFIKEFAIKTPDYSIRLECPNDPVKQFSDILSGIGHVFKKHKPYFIMTVGDTNSVAAATLAATKSKVPAIHIEAGLRSYDWRMQEEYNRRMTDHVSDILFSPTIESTMNLRNEQVQGKIYTVGNTVLDAVRLCMQSPLKSCDIDYGTRGTINNHSTGLNNNYILLTLHREENVDNPAILKRIFGVLAEIGINCIFPAHPRTIKRIQQFSLEQMIGNNIQVINPVGYHDFLMLLRNCKLVVTDSGGIQEEITSPFINKRALIFRDSTERRESITSGHAILCSLEHATIAESIRTILNSEPITLHSPYGDGHAADKIVNILKEEPILPLSSRALPKLIQEKGLE